MAGDGFTPRRENIVFLSLRRLDEAYTLLEKNNRTNMQNLQVSMEELLEGRVWNGKSMAATTKPSEVIVLQTMVLVQKAMEDEGERTTVGHEGTRQLLSATGFLPGNVEIPEWIQAGLGSFFNTPHYAFYTSNCMPSWSHLVDFKFHSKTKKIDRSKGGDILFHVVSDRYFRQARRTQSLADQEKEDNSLLAEQAKEEFEIARATSWAFVYFLAHTNRLSHLRKYFEEVGRLPRDLELDERAMASCFARAFEIQDANDPFRIDARKLEVLAAEWFRVLDTISLPITQVETELLRSREPPPPPKNPQGPGG
jgi:hypothetical protein